MNRPRLLVSSQLAKLFIFKTLGTGLGWRNGGQKMSSPLFAEKLFRGLPREKGMVEISKFSFFRPRNGWTVKSLRNFSENVEQSGYWMQGRLGLPCGGMVLIVRTPKFQNS